ncbi:unnamed protein product [Paramecium pentaurelia]|uniref:PROP1-like PPR domain-containing protein n=1 Tax=Paramecium pentaurelia TaxID=43138 RepID=A0A8S1VHF5_9CILI|nr:unnamed protein product [Paramecium pentaurelia]
MFIIHTKLIAQFAKKQTIKSMFAPIQKSQQIKESEEFKEVKKLFYKINDEDNIKQSILENYQPQHILKQIDTNLTNYFQKRSVDIKSINFLLQAIVAQNKFDQIDEIQQFMANLKIKPNLQTHMCFINAYGKFRNVEKAEACYQIAQKQFGSSLHLYNTLINVYCKNLQSENALRIFNDLKRDGFEPDLPIYTTLINSFYRVKQWKKCWDLFDEARLESHLKPDENLIGLMIEICADTHEAEKAIQLYDQMNEMEFRDTTYIYNSIIKALGSRKDYAEKALEYYRKMVMTSIQMDSDTIVCTLKACSQCGDVKIAHEVIKQMKQHQITPNKYIYTQIIRVYIGACSLPNLDNKIVDEYIKDAWKIFNEAASKQMISSRTLNSMCELMVAANRLPDLEGQVLPLYDQYQIPKDQFTYEQIIKILFIEKRLLDLFRIFDIVSTKMQPTFQSVSNYLDTAILLADEEKVIDALEWFKKIDRQPKYKQLKQLGTMKNLPLRIHALMNEYDAKFGKVSDKIYRNENNQRPAIKKI